MKRCIDCLEELPIEAFSVEVFPIGSKAYPNGKTKTRADCKKCKARKTREARRNPDSRHKEVLRKSQIKHADQRKEDSLQWRINNQEKVAENLRRWRLENPERHRMHERKRRAAKKSSVSTLTVNEWNEILESLNGMCFWCGVAEWEHVEHIVALINGGGHTAGNVVPACKPCNLKKGTMDPLVFLFKMREVANAS